MRTLALGTLFALSSLVGCAADGSAEEDAAADAAPAGKADGVSFSTGPYQTVEIDYVADEPLLAWFHDNGEIDFTRLINEDYETEYFQGTYKLYRYGGKDRIRLTDRDGTVILRSDRTTSETGKLEFGGETWYQPRKLAGQMVDCLAMKVIDYQPLEESMTEWEYPNISVDKAGTAYTLNLGGSAYDESDSSIEVVEGATEFKATATIEDTWSYGVRIAAASPRRGTVFYSESAGSPAQDIATIVCR